MGLKDFANDVEEKSGFTPDMELRKDSGWFSSGSIIIDAVIGKGIPKGVITEIVGPETGGKTTTALHAAKNIQAKGKGVVFIDAEQRLDQLYAKNIGVSLDPELWLLYQKTWTDEVYTIIHNVFDGMPDNNVGLIVIDSVGGVIPKSWDTPENKKDRPGERAQFWSRMMPYLSAKANETQLPVILINQFRKKLEFSGPMSVDDDPMGGKAVKFFKSVSVAVKSSKKDWKKQKHELTGDDINVPVGNEVEVRNLKNSVGLPYKRGKAYIRYGEGFDNVVVASKILLNKGVLKIGKSKKASKDDMVGVEQTPSDKKKGGAKTYVEVLKNGEERIIAVGLDRLYKAMKEESTYWHKKLTPFLGVKYKYF